MKTLTCNYNQKLAEYFTCKQLYLDENLSLKPNIRKLTEQPWQQTKAECWNEVTETLCNLGFIQAKSAAKMTYDLVNDFNEVLLMIPDNMLNIKQEISRQEKLDKYAKDLVLLSKGEIKELEIPESIKHWSVQKTESEIKRITKNPTRLDILNNFSQFLGQEAGNLHENASEIPNLAIQQAWNKYDRGPVGEAASHSSQDILGKLFLRTVSTRPEWNPLPSATKTFISREPIRGIAMSADGKVVVSASLSSCTIWNMGSGKLLRTLNHGAAGIAITPDGKRIISAGECNLWDSENGELLKTFNVSESLVTAVAITNDGKIAVFASHDSACIVWDIEKGAPLGRLDGNYRFIETIAVTIDQSIAISGSGDGTCTVWDLKSKKQIKVLNGHKAIVWSVAITPDGKKAVSASADKTCIVWDIETGKALKILEGHNDVVSAVSITPDGKSAVSASFDKSCILWDLETGSSLKILKGHTDRVVGITITADRKYAVSASSDNTCIVWDLEMGQSAKDVSVPGKIITSIEFTLDGKHGVSHYEEESSILWDIDSGKFLNKLESNNDITSCIAITPDGKLAISPASDNSCTLWDMGNKKHLKSLIGHTSEIGSGCISSDGKTATTSSGNICILWDLELGKSIKIIDGKSMLQKIILEDNQFFSIPHKHSLFYNSIRNVTAIAVADSGKYAILAVSDLPLIVYDLENSTIKTILKGHKSVIHSIVVTPDEKHLLSASYDKTCILWDLQSGRKLARYFAEEYLTCLSLYISTIVAGGASGKPIFLKLPDIT